MLNPFFFSVAGNGGKGRLKKLHLPLWISTLSVDGTIMCRGACTIQHYGSVITAIFH